MEEIGDRQKCWSWSSNNLTNRCEESTHYKRSWWWERLKTGGEGDNREWDGFIASLTQWTWVLANSRSWWWTGKPGVVQSMGSQRVGHDWVTEEQQQNVFSSFCCLSLLVNAFIMNGKTSQKQWEGNRQEGQRSPNGGNRLQVPDIFNSLKGRRKQTGEIYFFPSLYKFKRRFLLKCCVAMTPGFTWSQLFSNLELTNTFFFLWKCLS